MQEPRIILEKLAKSLEANKGAMQFDYARKRWCISVDEDNFVSFLISCVDILGVRKMIAKETLQQAAKLLNEAADELEKGK